MSKLLLCILFVVFQMSVLFGQNDARLRQLDSIAFYALEHGDSSVITKANNLLTASSKGKESFYTINAHTILGIVNKDKGYYLTSLNHYLKALNTAEKLVDSARVSACYTNIGNVYLLQENYPKSVEYFNKSLKIEEKFDRPLQKSIRYYNLGDAYSKMDSFDLALSYFTNSLLIEQKLNNSEGITFAELGIADVYIKIDRLKDAVKLLDKISNRIENFQIEEKILLSLLRARVHHQHGEFELARTELSLAENISITNNFRIHLLDIYQLQIDLFKQTNDWKNATLVYDRFAALKDELNTVKVKNQLEDLTFQNELNKKELEIKLIQEEKDLALKNQELEKNTANHRSKIVWFLIAAFILLFALIFIGIRKLAQDN